MKNIARKHGTRQTRTTIVKAQKDVIIVINPETGTNADIQETEIEIRNRKAQVAAKKDILAHQGHHPLMILDKRVDDEVQAAHPHLLQHPAMAQINVKEALAATRETNQQLRLCQM